MYREPLRLTLREQGIKISRYAVNNNMIIITLDTDFACIYHNVLRGIIGVIVIRVKHPKHNNMIETLTTTLKKIKIDDIRNNILMLFTEKSLQEKNQRNLPNQENQFSLKNSLTAKRAKS